MQAFGGLVVGLVTKYAGGVVKGFALIAGTWNQETWEFYKHFYLVEFEDNLEGSSVVLQCIFQVL